MISQNNLTYAFVGAYAGNVGVDDLAGLDNSSAGILEFSDQGLISIFGKNASGNIKQSNIFNFAKDIKSVNITEYSAYANKKAVVGYNGTSGSLNFADSTLHTIKIEFPLPTSIYEEANYISGSSATQKAVAEGLLENAIVNFTDVLEKKYVNVIPGLICSSAVTSDNAFVNDATVVQGNTYITLSTATTYTSDATALAAGDYIRIGTVGGGTALTSEIYQVISISDLIVKLDRAVQEDSGTYAADTADIEVIPATTIAATTVNFGITLTGQDLEFEVGLKPFKVCDFNVYADNGALDSDITTLTAATRGSGSYKEVAELEWDLSGNFGEPYKVADYPLTTKLNAAEGSNYDMCVINLETKDHQTLTGHESAFITIMLIFVTSSTNRTALTTYFSDYID